MQQLNLKREAQLRVSFPQLGSVPDFNLGEFNGQSCFAKHLGLELLILADHFGLDFGYQRKSDRLTPAEFAVSQKLVAVAGLLQNWK